MSVAKLKEKKLAIVYDWFDSWGGVERVLEVFHEMYPEAPFYTSYLDPQKAIWTNKYEIKTSYIQNLPDFIKKNRIRSIPFYPMAFETFDFAEYGTVISITSAFAKGIITSPDTRHICYMLTPTRFLWTHQSDYFTNPIFKTVSSPVISHLKKWDKVAAQRPDKIISISKTVRDRCKKYYDRESEIIYPPFDMEYWEKINSKLKTQNSKLQLKSQNYFIVISRLESYKRIDLAISTFNSLPEKNLIVVGSGTQEKKLKKIANKNIQFLSSIGDQQLASLYAHAQALIMPQEEDFGIVALEAQYFGCPVITLNKGGATETVTENKTGIYFKYQNTESLTEALKKYDKIENQLKKSAKKYGPENCKNFAKSKFTKQIDKLIIEK